MEQDLVGWIFCKFSRNDQERFLELEEEASEHKHGKTAHKFFDCSLMDLADEIAYGVHDLEDAIALKIIDRELFESKASEVFDLETCSSLGIDSKLIFDNLFCPSKRKIAIGRLIHAFINSVQVMDMKFDSPILGYRAKLPPKQKISLNVSEALLRKMSLHPHSVQSLEFKGRHVVTKIFEAINSDRECLLPDDLKAKALPRAICDYIAGMTDPFAAKIYQRLYIPGYGSIFEKL